MIEVDFYMDFNFRGKYTLPTCGLTDLQIAYP
jgi:hypothetical protein